MKPARIFLFFFLLLLLLTSSFALLPASFRLPWTSNIKNPVKPFLRQLTHKPLNHIIPVITPLQDTTKTLLKKKKKPLPHISFQDSLLLHIPSLEYSDQVKEQWQALIHYYAGLRENNLTSHILYYGDSQIEGDRITHQLRDSLQQWFGGGGPGLFLPVMTVPETYSMRIQASPEWKREACDLTADTPMFSPSTGLFLEHNYTLINSTSQTSSTASFTVSWQSFGSLRVKTAGTFYLWYHGRADTATLTVNTGERTFTSLITSGPDLRVFSGHPGTFTRSLSFVFESGTPLILEGVSLEKGPGIMVDNIPLRGRSLAEFSRTNPIFFSQMTEKMNVKLVVLQFGLNVVAGGNRAISRFPHRLKHQLDVLRKIAPDIMVIIVGTTDMDKSPGISDSLSSKLRNIQRDIALSEGCLFWDSYRAMGGYNAAHRWLQQQPSLMRPDAVHLSRDGSQLLSEMLIEALHRDISSLTEQDSNGTEP